MEVGNWPGAQYVTIVVHKKSEIDTPAFREFLARAAEAVKGRVATAAGGVEGNMPWKKDGEKWHLGDKGFPPGRGAVVVCGRNDSAAIGVEQYFVGGES